MDREKNIGVRERERKGANKREEWTKRKLEKEREGEEKIYL